MMTRTIESRLLRNAFRINAVFSGLSGLVALFGAGFLVSLTGIELPWLFRGLGIMLLGFAANLLWYASRPTKVWEAWSIVVSDIAWVLGSAVILFSDWVPLTTEGWWLVAVIADIVAVFAAIQIVALWKSPQPSESLGTSGGHASSWSNKQPKMQ